MVKIDFSKTHETYGLFADAIYLPDNHVLTPEAIEIMKQERFDNWVQHIITQSNQPPVEIPVPPTE